MVSIWVTQAVLLDLLRELCLPCNRAMTTVKRGDIYTRGFRFRLEIGEQSILISIYTRTTANDIKHTKIISHRAYILIFVMTCRVGPSLIFHIIVMFAPRTKVHRPTRWKKVLISFFLFILYD